MKVSKDLKILYLFAFVFVLFAFIYYPIADNYPDTQSYIRAWDNISNGHLDELRTPVYPIYLGVMKTLFGDKFETYAVLGQYVIFLLSIAAFYSICRRIFDSQKVIFWTTLFYTVNPCIISWCGCLLTESLAVSGIIFLLYCLFRLYDMYSFLRLFNTMLLLIVLLMLRPAFIYLIPLLLVFWTILIFKSEKRRQSIAGLTSIFVTLIVLFTYMYNFNQIFGYFSTSSVGINNSMFIARQYGMYNPAVIEDSDFRKDVVMSYDLHGERYKEFLINPYSDEELCKEIGNIAGKYSHKTINDAIVSSYMSNPIKVITTAMRIALKAYNMPLFFTYANWGILSSLLSYIQLYMGFIYLFVTIYTLILFVLIWKYRCFPYLSALMFFIATGNLAVVFAGAQAEWNRLIIPSYPIFILLIGQLCTIFSVKSIKQLKLK